MALREALAVRQAVAAGTPLTAAQAAALRAGAAVAARSAGPAGAHAPARRPATRRAPARKPAGRRKVRAERSGSSWSTRLGVVAMSTLLLPAAAALVLPADGGDGGASDTTALALAAQSTLFEDAGRYRELAQEVARREAALQRAEEAEQAALAEVQARQETVGDGAAALYRATPEQRHPLLALDVTDPAATSGALHGQALVERTQQELRGDVVRAQRSTVALTAASGRVSQAEAAVREAEDLAEAVLATVRSRVDGLTPEITAALAGLNASTVTGPQRDRDQHATARWQEYLARLSAAGVEPPAAADIADPGALPAGFSPALDAGGRPIPGVVWAVIDSSPVTVLPAETVAAVSNALSQLGKPFVPGSNGPDAYDCGGFAASSWLLAGYAVPGTPQDQWTSGAAVPVADLQVGDLVFPPGGQDVGIYLGDGEVVSASAATYQVSVRSVVAGSSATRVPLPAPAQANAALPIAEVGACGAPLPPEDERTGAWGGWSNGRISGEVLCEIGVGRHALRCDAAAAYGQLDAAYRAEFGSPLCITDSYRSYASQVSAYARKPALAAWPGTSNHGWALAVDLCGGIHVSGSAQWTWMTANAARFGFVQPFWASNAGEKPEPWHWEFGYIS